MQGGQPIQGISVFRPDEYRLSPQWKVEVVSSCLQKYRMVVDPLSFDTTRASFSLRSPGQGVILSPQIYIEARWKIDFPGHCLPSQMHGAVYQPVEIANSTADDAVRANETYLMGYAPKVCFSSGDGFGKAISNIQITINGASISNSRLNTYKWAVDKCWFSQDVFQSRFSQCGGRYHSHVHCLPHTPFRKRVQFYDPSTDLHTG